MLIEGGVNLPCHLVIVKGTEYFDGKSKAYIDFPVTDILQMIGRAGRPGFDNHAVACIFVQETKKNFYKKFLHEPFPVESSLHLQLPEHLNAEICGGALSSASDCIDYLTWTYYFRRLLMNPSYYGLENTSALSIRNHLLKLVEETLQELCLSQCVEMKLEHHTFGTTFLGKIASFYYLKYKTPLFLRQAMSVIHLGNLSRRQVTSDLLDDFSLRALSIESLLKMISDVEEYSQIPVRHNEEKLNDALAGELGYLVGAKSHLLGALDSPHTKVFLLLLSHQRRTSLPIMDYINDTKMILDQFARIANAAIDIAADEGWIDIVIDLITLTQLIHQVRNRLC